MRKRLLSVGRFSDVLPPNTEHGFTLIELILVLIIISIAFAIVAPAVGNRLGGNDSKRTAAQLRTTLELLRLRALTEGKEQRLIIDPEDNQYWQESGRQIVARDDSGDAPDHGDEQITPSDGDVQLSATSLWVREEGQVEFRFYPDGTNSGGEITIEQQRETNVIAYIITLNPLLGTATVHYAGE